MPRLTFPAKAKVFAIWVRWRRGATLLARVIILPSRESRKRDAAIRLILEKTQHSPHFLRLCVRFSLCGDMLRLSYF